MKFTGQVGKEPFFRYPPGFVVSPNNFFSQPKQHNMQPVRAKEPCRACGARTARHFFAHPPKTPPYAFSLCCNHRVHSAPFDAGDILRRHCAKAWRLFWKLHRAWARARHWAPTERPKLDFVESYKNWLYLPTVRARAVRLCDARNRLHQASFELATARVLCSLPEELSALVRSFLALELMDAAATFDRCVEHALSKKIFAGTKSAEKWVSAAWSTRRQRVVDEHVAQPFPFQTKTVNSWLALARVGSRPLAFQGGK